MPCYPQHLEPEQQIKHLENHWQLLHILKCNRLMQCLLHCSVWCRIVAIKTFTVLYERTDGLALGTLLHIISAELPKFPNNMFSLVFTVVKEVFPHFPCLNHFHNACRKKLYGIQTSTLVGWGFPFYSMYFHTSPCSQDLQTGGTEEPFTLIAYMEYLKGCSQVMQRVVILLSATFLNVLEMVTKTWSAEMLLYWKSLK